MPEANLQKLDKRLWSLETKFELLSRSVEDIREVLSSLEGLELPLAGELEPINREELRGAFIGLANVGKVVSKLIGNETLYNIFAKVGDIGAQDWLLGLVELVFNLFKQGKVEEIFQLFGEVGSSLRDSCEGSHLLEEIRMATKKKASKPKKALKGGSSKSHQLMGHTITDAELRDALTHQLEALRLIAEMFHLDVLKPIFEKAQTFVNQDWFIQAVVFVLNMLHSSSETELKTCSSLVNELMHECEGQNLKGMTGDDLAESNLAEVFARLLAWVQEMFAKLSQKEPQYT